MHETWHCKLYNIYRFATLTGVRRFGSGAVAGGRHETRRFTSAHEQPGFRSSQLPVILSVGCRFCSRQRRFGVGRTRIRKNEVLLSVSRRVLRQVAEPAAAGQRCRLIDGSPLVDNGRGIHRAGRRRKMFSIGLQRQRTGLIWRPEHEDYQCAGVSQTTHEMFIL